MIRKFRIALNGKEYVAEIEELGVTSTMDSTLAPSLVHEQIVAPQPVVVAPPQPVVEEAQESVVAPPTPVAQNSNIPGLTTEAPMPGNILDVCVKVGDLVIENQVLVVLEAMKMQNELVAPKAGTITAVHVTKNSHIDVGAPIVTIS